MRYSIEPKDRTYAKEYGFLSFAKNVGTHLSNKYGQTFFDSAKKSTTDAIKNASKRSIQKKAEATDDLTGNKIPDKIINTSKNSSRKLHSAELLSQNSEANDDIEIPKERFISPEKI